MDLGVKIILSIFSFVLGAILASFGGVLSYRLPKKISIIKPRSYCPICKKSIKWYDNIPIISYIILRGKCRNCKANIALSSFFIELFSAILYSLTFYKYEFSIMTLMIFILLFLFVIIASNDFESYIIYDINLIIFSFISILITLYKIFFLKKPLFSYLLGSIVGFGFFSLYRLFFKIVKKEEVIGTGDIYLTGIAGTMLGPINVLLSIGLGSIFGAIFELTKLRIRKMNLDTVMPFAPYLVLGFSIMLIYGDKLVDWYMKVWI